MRWKGVAAERADFADFYRTSKDNCVRAVLVSVRDPDVAQDLVAEAFARAWASWRMVSSCVGGPHGAEREHLPVALGEAGTGVVYKIKGGTKIAVTTAANTPGARISGRPQRRQTVIPPRASVDL